MSTPLSPLSGDRTSIDLLRLKADVGHYLDTARYTEGLEREARQRVLKAVIGEAETSESLSS